MNQEDKHKNWALEPDEPSAEPAVEPGPDTRSARSGNARRWPVFGILSWLAVPAAYPMMAFTTLIAESIGIDTMHTNSPYGGLGVTGPGLIALFLGADISLFVGLAFGVVGFRRREKWWGIALFGAMVNSVLLVNFLYMTVGFLFMWITA